MNKLFGQFVWVILYGSNSAGQFDRINWMGQIVWVNCRQTDWVKNTYNIEWTIELREKMWNKYHQGKYSKSEHCTFSFSKLTWALKSRHWSDLWFSLHSAGRNCIKCINYSITFNSSLERKRTRAETTGNESLIISRRKWMEDKKAPKK